LPWGRFGSISATERLEKVDEHWYFSEYDFTVFPWLIIFVAFSVCIRASVVLYFYLRRQKREQRVPTTS